jgi:hypothetical protein
MQVVVQRRQVALLLLPPPLLLNSNKSTHVSVADATKRNFGMAQRPEVRNKNSSLAKAVSRSRFSFSFDSRCDRFRHPSLFSQCEMRAVTGEKPIN